VTNAQVETFAHDCTVEAMPPTIEEVTRILMGVLPPGSGVLQWAIVKADPKSCRVWIEGSMVIPKGA
jgi:hypothetical protein